MTETLSPVANEINEYFANCNGTDQYYKHWMSRIPYSAGVHFVAEKANAFWLIDVVLSHQTNRKAVKAANGFQVWRLKHNKTGNGCVVTMDDGGQDGEPKILIRQRISYTDFPKGVEIVMYLENDTLILREER